MLTLTLKAIVIAAMSVVTGYTNGVSIPARSLATELGPFVQKYDIKKVRAELERVRSRKSFPQLGRKARGDYPGMKISLRLMALNQALFGNPNIVTAVAAEDDCSGLHRASRVIVIPKEVVKALENSPIVLDFTLAHALAHYAFELQFAKDAGLKSPFGNSSRSEALFSKSAESARSHAEVDALALGILALSGQNPYLNAKAAELELKINKEQNDRLVGWLMRDITPIRMIPDEYMPRVQDNYIRAYSLVRTMPAYRPVSESSQNKTL